MNSDKSYQLQRPMYDV